MSAAKPSTDNPLFGVALAAAAWAAFSMQDAIVKYLVVTLPVPEILFSRSIAIVALASLTLRRADVSVLMGPRNLIAIGLRSLLILVAWISYYTAARWLTLPALVTLYFASPLFVVALSRVTLGETVGPARWFATIVGFCGVLVAADLSEAPSALPALLTLVAALFWAATALLTRRLSQAVSTRALMFGANLLFVVVCLATAPFVFVRPNAFELVLLVLLSIFGGAGQFFLFQGMRIAPASAIAPFEYTSLAWATLWGWTIFGDLPNAHVLAGGAVILASGLAMLIVEGRRYRAARA
ncbi:MAG TPA: DMT family transporter [Roseiarcus sp.]|nr:DMT family transporter [Roseiarcus sp.]